MIELAIDDKRLGAWTDKVDWPEVDYAGRLYRKQDVVIRHVTDNRFVVIPAQQDSDELQFKLVTPEGWDKRFTEPPVSEPPKRAKDK